MQNEAFSDVPIPSQQFAPCSPVTRIPPELLGHIFNHLIPPSYTLHPQWQLIPHAIWPSVVQDITALTLVCKAWSYLATEVLYNQIIIQHVYQLPPLLRSLESPNSNRGDLIRSLTLWFSSTTPWYEVYTEDTERIFRLCHRLTSLVIVLNGSWPRLSIPALYDSPECAIWDRFPSLTHLELDDHVSSPTACKVLNRCSNLVSLVFGVDNIYPLCDGSPAPPVTLSELLRLRFKFHYTGRGDLSIIARFGLYRNWWRSFFLVYVQAWNVSSRPMAPISVFSI
ncbi:hypothetical protein JAAARDRAFT_470903 [Jaapia argillacea MUCL 33604]|uniref:Uncharacterized protein n=1 Tax=Jaapia argillacea MUCL 33604 TaxID=933084 RepID=A0A067Q9E6_9AGAM|nr:hypothetical protein JAAARDRAFT_470903 [Jaapia argillacea MUCL 33604]